VEREKEDAQSGSNGEGKLMDIRLINPGLYLKMDGWMDGWMDGNMQLIFS